MTTDTRIKSEVDELALFGAPPAFSDLVHVGRPNIGDRQRLFERLGDLLGRRWLTNNGPYVQEFEQRLAELIGAKHVIAMCNATVGLEIAIRAAGLKGEVILPSFTFVATAHALQWQEITPVFCDIDPRTHNIDPDQVEQLITPRTTGIIGVHVWGRACEIEALTVVARRYGLKLLFDAAHAFACSHHGQMIGNFGDAEIFSFHATKFFNTFEGGAIATNDDALAAKVRLMKNFGFAGYDNVIYVGTNGKMSEVSAAMGLTGLECLDAFVASNRANHKQYQCELAGLDAVRMVMYDQREQCNYQYVVLEVDSAQAGVSRDVLLKALHAENVLARCYFYPGCHRMEPYRSYYPLAGLVLPETERLTGRVLSLPTGTAVDSNAIAAIAGIIRTVITHGEEVQCRLAKASA